MSGLDFVAGEPGLLAVPAMDAQEGHELGHSSDGGDDKYGSGGVRSHLYVAYAMRCSG